MVLIAFLSPSLGGSQVYPDFSHFEDPNESQRPPGKSETEAQPPCPRCEPETKKGDLVKDGREIKKKLEDDQKKRSPHSLCMSCEKLETGYTKKGSVADADFWKQYPQVSGYSENPQVQDMIDHALKNAERTSQGLCYRYVKEACCRNKRGKPCNGGSLVDSYLQGNPVFPENKSRVQKRFGKNAIKNFESQGYKDLLKDPVFNKVITNMASAPKGAILIYSGGKNGGHIEIKTDHGTKGTFVSDFKSPASILENKLAGRAGKSYKLQAVMIKPAERLK